jgi:hypothetical protein
VKLASELLVAAKMLPVPALKSALVQLLAGVHFAPFASFAVNGFGFDFGFANCQLLFAFLAECVRSEQPLLSFQVPK